MICPSCIFLAASLVAAVAVAERPTDDVGHPPWPSDSYTVNPEIAVFLARSERPTGAGHFAGAVAPSWRAALPPYAVNPEIAVFLARSERPTGAGHFAGAVAPSWLAALPPYAVIVKASTLKDPAWKKVAACLKSKHNASIITYEASVDESLDALKRRFPRYTCFVAPPAEATGDFVRQVHQLTRKLDDDPYTDTFWGILTGYDAENALAIAGYSKPLVVKRVASGTEFATEMVVEGQWYDELVQGKHVKKEPGDKARELKGPADTTQALVDLLNDYKADLMITSGHATQADWQIGFRYRNGQFRSKAGQMYGLDTNGKRIEIDSPNPKVYLPVGNCLMGDINGPDAMALAWMNDVGVKQMIGYTRPTWFGYMGWGVLDYFLEQPGRYTLTEAFFANHHALIHRLNDPRTPEVDRRGLAFDRDVVAFYGDPKWSAKMAEMPRYYEQVLEIRDGVYTLSVTPRRGRDSFKPVNTNGSQRGGRPIIQFLPHRIKDVELLDGQEFRPVVTDDFILVPRPRQCDPDRRYVVRFKAIQLGLGNSAPEGPAS